MGKSELTLALIISFIFTSLNFSSSISYWVIPNCFFKLSDTVRSIEKFLIFTSVALCYTLNPKCYDGSKTSVIPSNIVLSKSNFILFYKSSKGFILITDSKSISFKY